MKKETFRSIKEFLKTIIILGLAVALFIGYIEFTRLRDELETEKDHFNNIVDMVVACDESGARKYYNCLSSGGEFDWDTKQCNRVFIN